MTARRLLAEKRFLKFPDYFTFPVVFAHFSVGFVCDQVRAGRGAPDQARVAVFAHMVTYQFDFMLKLSLSIDLDNTPDSGLCNHGEAVLQALAGMHFQGHAGVSVRGGRVIFPNHFSFRIEFGYLGPTGLIPEVSVGQQGGFVEAAAFDVALEGAVLC